MQKQKKNALFVLYKLRRDADCPRSKAGENVDLTGEYQS